MAILKVLCIKDLNPKLTSFDRLKLGLPKEWPKEGIVYNSDGYCYFKEWGWYIHLTEFPDPDDQWNAEKFVMADDPGVNIETFLNEMYRDQVIPAQGDRRPLPSLS
jgi:hypothetical protein